MAKKIWVLLSVSVMSLPAISASPPSSLQEDEDKLEELRHQVSIMEKVRELDVTLVALRDNIRPTSVVEKLVDQPGTGYLLRQVTKLGGELTAELKSAPQWLKNAKDKADVLRKLAAAGDLAIRMQRAVSEAETSSSSEKLVDMMEVFKDALILVEVVAKVNPVVSAYLGLLAKGIENIAESAEIIEAATKKTNWAIEEVDRTIYRTDPENETVESHPMDPAIWKLWEEIRKLERKINEKDYEKVANAEKKCAEEYHKSIREIDQYRIEAGRFRRALAQLERARTALPFREKALRLETERIEIELPLLKAKIVAAKTPEDALRARDTYNRRRGMVEANKATLIRLREKHEKEGPIILERMAALRVPYNARVDFLERFDECVARQLKNEEFSDPRFVKDRFLRYDLKPEARRTHQCRWGHPVASSHFFGGGEGWSTWGDAEKFTVRPGYIMATDQGRGVGWGFKAPAKFLKDKSGSYGHAITFELNVIKGGTGTIIYSLVGISDGKTDLWFDPDPNPPARGWTKLSVCFHESHKGWHNHTTGKAATREDFQRVLKGLEELSITGEQVHGPDVAGLRNVVMYGR